MTHFSDRLADAIASKNSRVLVGIDPRLDRIPKPIREKHLAAGGDALERAAAALLEFGQRVVDAVQPHAAAVKPQVAFYEQYGWPGFRAFVETVQYAHAAGLLVIGDVKRGDIGSTADAYAAGLLGEVEIAGERIEPMALDAVTINPYLGSDGVQPFIDAAAARGKGVYVLVKTSNPSSAEFQDLQIGDDMTHERMADAVAKWGASLVGECGYSLVGAVVGATHPAALNALRERMPTVPFLVPGYGAQGGGAADVAAAFDAQGQGAIVNSSRGIIFAYQAGDPDGEGDWQAAVEAAAAQMKADLNQAIGV